MILESDKRLIERSCRGDQGALGDLLTGHQQQVYQTIYGRVMNREDALDLTQAAFEQVLKNIRGLRDPSCFHAWLDRIANNVCLSWLRQRSKMQGILQPWPEAGTPLFSDPEEPCMEELWAAIEQLSEVNRQALLMHYFDGRSYEEIGQQLGIPCSTVRSRLQEARRFLRASLKHLGPPLLLEHFGNSLSDVLTRWFWRRPDEDLRRYEIVCNDAAHALKLTEQGGHSAHLWAPVQAAGECVLSVCAKATQADAIWQTAVYDHLAREHFNCESEAIFSVEYHHSHFVLYSGDPREREHIAVRIDRQALVENGEFHHYQCIRRKGKIELRRDGVRLASVRDIRHRVPIGAVELCGTGHFQGDGVGAYYDNVVLRSL